MLRILEYLQKYHAFYGICSNQFSCIFCSPLAVTIVFGVKEKHSYSIRCWKPPLPSNAIARRMLNARCTSNKQTWQKHSLHYFDLFHCPVWKTLLFVLIYFFCYKSTFKNDHWNSFNRRRIHSSIYIFAEKHSTMVNEIYWIHHQNHRKLNNRHDTKSPEYPSLSKHPMFRVYWLIPIHLICANVLCYL